MKKRFYKGNLLVVFYLTLSSWQCTESPIEADLSHLSLNIDTLSIKLVMPSHIELFRALVLMKDYISVIKMKFKFQYHLSVLMTHCIGIII